MRQKQVLLSHAILRFSTLEIFKVGHIEQEAKLSLG